METPLCLAKKFFVAYVPVVHRKLLEVVRSEDIPVLVLGEEFITQFPQLSHDLRAVNPVEAVTMFKSLGLQASLLDETCLKSLLFLSRPTFVLPTDEVMREFAERYLSRQSVDFRDCFVRWDKVNATSENDVPVDLEITYDQFSREIMKQCHQLGQLSSDWWRQVGAIAVRQDGQVLYSGINKMKPTDFSSEIDGDIRGCFGFGERVEICGTIHAEAALVAGAARLGIPLAGVDFYCTTFPCPVCARLLAEAGVARLIYEIGYSVCDAFDILKSADVKVVKLIP